MYIILSDRGGKTPLETWNTGSSGRRAGQFRLH